jgi:large subunit ribosomal protein L32
MAVPKKRHSKSRKRISRSKWKIETPNLRACPSCGEKGVPHRACTACGSYNGKPVIQIKVKEKKSKDS